MSDLLFVIGEFLIQLFAVKFAVHSMNVRELKIYLGATSLIITAIAILYISSKISRKKENKKHGILHRKDHLQRIRLINDRSFHKPIRTIYRITGTHPGILYGCGYRDIVNRTIMSGAIVITVTMA